MNIFRLLAFLVTHPANRAKPFSAVARFARWQLGSRLLNQPVIHGWVGGTKLVVTRGETGLTGNLYCGLHEFEDMSFLLHLLRADDFFVDIGANVGSYTVLASGVQNARTMCFEPVPATYERLRLNLLVNRLDDKVEARNVGLGGEVGSLRFSSAENCTNHVLTDAEASREDGILVPVQTLDGALGGQVPVAMKIDVEGFETHVLQGAKLTMSDPRLNAVIMELNGSGSRYGFDETSILSQMLALGFHTCTYEPFQRRLVELDGKCLSSGNTIFVRDLERTKALLRDAKSFVLNGVEV